MAEKKRQHYVPRFLLKLFSVDQNKKLINMYNINKNETYSGIPLDKQAAKDYFYGKDSIVEESFQELETLSSEVIRNIIKLNELPKFNSQEHGILLYFILSLNARTLYKSEENSELIIKMLKQIASRHPKLKDFDVKDVEFEIENSIFPSLKAVDMSYPLASDLRYKLLVNKTHTPFIISDHPVVFYNQFLESKKAFGSIIYIAAKGLEIFFPISPTHILVLYDHKVYKVGTSKKTVVEINEKEVVSKLNGLQYLNANMNLFYNNDLTPFDISKIIKNYATFRKIEKANLQALGNNTNFILVTSEVSLRCKLSLPFIKILDNAKKYNLDNKTMHIRNEGLFGLYERFQHLVDKKIYKPSEFNEFIEDHRNNLHKLNVES